MEITTMRIEAENLTDITGYRLEDNAIASGGSLLSLLGGEENEVASVSFDFTGMSGNYNVKIGTYDENDGEATLELSQSGNLVGSILLDENPGGFVIAEDTQVTRIAATNLSIQQGDRFTITGFEDATEHARIDFIEFEPVSREPIRLEAEDADSISDYRLEANSVASGGEILSLKGGAGDEVGSASFTFEQQGIYDIALGTFDEDDGMAAIVLELNGTQIGETIMLNEDLGRNVADSFTQVSRNVASDIELNAGDVLTVMGFEDNGEFARLDYLEFTPAVSSEPIRLEAEDADSLLNYRLESNSVASGGEILSLKGDARDEVGSASFTFDRQGTYDIVLGTFDENDGMASITLELNGAQIGETIVLDQELGRNVPDSFTQVSRNIASGISLNAGDVLTVNGFEQAGEFARLDYLEFTATEL
ncbi:MAG: hypothetical protein AAFQ41_01175 [Cyanobacteria bacterium J06623_7]